MDDESEYESALEHSLPSSKSPVSDSKKKKRKRHCDVCGSHVDEDTMTSRDRRNYTREHTHPSNIFWTCDECYSFSRFLDDYTESASSSTNQVQGPNDQAVDKEVVQQKTTNDSSNEISATHSPPQTLTSPAVKEASSPIQEQKQSDHDKLSDSESAK